MQLLNCTVAIGGEAGMTVFKERVTVPELMVLRAVHGDDAVRNIEVTGTTTFTSADERERLGLVYISPEGVVRETLGVVGSLPMELSEANIPEDFIISGSAQKTSKRRKAAEVESVEVLEQE
jgi:predicted nucleotidyltransferase